jgi:hypothetical protein
MRWLGEEPNYTTVKKALVLNKSFFNTLCLVPHSLSAPLVPCTYLGLAKLFFAELAKKGNTLYNVMPDIVSRLSDPEVGIAEDQFR